MTNYAGYLYNTHAMYPCETWWPASAWVGKLMLYAFSSKIRVPPGPWTKPRAVFLLMKIFEKFKNIPPYNTLGHAPLPYLRPRTNRKKRHSTLCKFLKKMVKFRRFEKNENRRKSVTGAKMHIFEKFKKGALGAPHELPNPKGLRDWTNEKKTAPLLRK